MKILLDNLQTKSGTQEHFFSFAFNSTDDGIFGMRGFSHLGRRDFTDNLLANKLVEIEARLT